MSPRWLMTVWSILLLLCPLLVTPQLIYIKTAICVLCSGAFVVASCASNVRLSCRIVAFKLNLLCRTYPCTNYGAPTTRSCRTPPFGCFPWNIRIFGLCEPFKYCCKNGIFAEPDEGNNDARSQLSSQTLQQQTPNSQQLAFMKRVSKNNIKFAVKSGRNLAANSLDPSIQSSWNKNLPVRPSNASFVLPSTPEEYMQDLPINEDDPAIVEQTIKDQYKKLKAELNAINHEEQTYGREMINTPSFEEFSAAALGETAIL